MTLTTVEQWQEARQQEVALAVYFSGDACAVCHALWPKLLGLFRQRFPNIALATVPTERAVELAGQLQVFAVPTLIVYFRGAENWRASRSFAPGAVADALARPYGLLFADRGR